MGDHADDRMGDRMDERMDDRLTDHRLGRGPDARPGDAGDAGDGDALAVEVTAEESAFLALVARPLQAPERLADDFESRLLAAVRAEAAPRPADVVPLPVRPAGGAPGWWRRPLRVSPLAALAAAAGLAVVVSAATLAATAGRPGAPGAPEVAAAPAAAADTVHVVRFVLVEPGARHVALV